MMKKKGSKLKWWRKKAVNWNDEEKKAVNWNDEEKKAVNWNDEKNGKITGKSKPRSWKHILKGWVLFPTFRKHSFLCFFFILKCDPLNLFII